MAIARPIRVLALLALGLCSYLIFTLLGGPKPLQGPGDRLDNLQRDPNLDRMRPRFSAFVATH